MTEGLRKTWEHTAYLMRKSDLVVQITVSVALAKNEKIYIIKHVSVGKCFFMLCSIAGIFTIGNIGTVKHTEFCASSAGHIYRLSLLASMLEIYCKHLIDSENIMM